MNAKANGKLVAAKTSKKEPKGKIANGTKAIKAAFPGSYQKFANSDYSDGTKIRAKATNTKLVAVGTYGKLKALIVGSLAKGDSLETIGKSLGVSGSRISEFCVIFSLERPAKPKAKKASKAKPAKKAPKPKAADQGDEGDV